MKQGDLDIRKISRNNLSLTVGNYFKFLEMFIVLMPKVLQAFNRIAAHEAADNDFRFLQETKALLENIGYNENLAVFDDASGAIKRGHFKFASDCIHDILGAFTVFCERLMATHETYGPAAKPGTPGAAIQ